MFSLSLSCVGCSVWDQIQGFAYTRKHSSTKLKIQLSWDIFLICIYSPHRAPIISQRNDSTKGQLGLNNKFTVVTYKNLAKKLFQVHGCLKVNQSPPQHGWPVPIAATLELSVHPGALQQLNLQTLRMGLSRKHPSDLCAPRHVTFRCPPGESICSEGVLPLCCCVSFTG